jgi:hypothetical protein
MLSDNVGRVRGADNRGAYCIYIYKINHQFMTRDELKKINYERMTSWKERLNENYSTPVILLGIGHNSVEGRLFVLCTEELPHQDMIIFLQGALLELRGY